ncbi:MAG: RHS repeat-associated protein [Crocinitomicaceae bacterium]|jgi:RHS repeat-associated protein
MRLTKLFWALLIVCTSTTAYSGIEPTTGQIATPFGGTAVVIGQPEAQVSILASIPGAIEHDVQVLNKVMLGIDQSYQDYFGTAMLVEVELTVETWDIALAPLSSSTIILEINYDPFSGTTYVGRETASFNDAYKIDISLENILVNGVSVTELPANLFIQGDILIERYVEFNTPTALLSFNSILPIDKDCNTIDDGINVTWPVVVGAVEYQLEWLHINDYGPDPLTPTVFATEASLEYDFKFNSTRITTTDNEYDLSLVFDHGWVLFRVRAIGVDLTTLPTITSNIYGVWSSPEIGTVDLMTGQRFEITTARAHENSLNWQYSATYAEEGKKKEVVSYYDGSLRNRQTTTRINSDDNVIVGETIYDHQGRPAINVLPTPVIDPACAAGDPTKQAALQFYPNYNQNESLDGYSRRDFDISDPGAICDVEAEPMGTQSGSSQYYSPVNPDQTAEQGYVPDANKFPFVQVEYTPDNTGRIRRQGGVGPEYQLGSGHESNYLYGQPNQVELDRMFGSEVGDATHYKKNVVIDAHGQASVSYMDQEGRVIATGLGGDNPDNLIGLESESANHVQLSINAFGSDDSQNMPSLEGDELVFSSQLLVAYAADYSFSYDFEIEPLENACLPGLCIDCVYDLTLELRDECGINLFSFPGGYAQTQVGKFGGTELTGYTFHGTCAAPLNGSLTETSLPLNLLPGSYSLVKRLTINDEARQAYVDTYFEEGSAACVTTFEEILDGLLANLDTTVCAVTCEQCYELLGSLEDYIADGNGTANDYYLQQEDCERLCDDGQISLCEVAYSQMRMDMAPGGQYAKYQDVSGNFYVGHPLSIFLSVNQLPANFPAPLTAYWTKPKLIDEYGVEQLMYVDMNGDRSRIVVSFDPLLGWLPAPANVLDIQFDPIENESFIYPEQLGGILDFVDNFEYSWTQSLVTYHPEYCYYETCARYEEPWVAGDFYSSDTFDELLEATTTFEEAVANGFILDSYAPIFTGGSGPVGVVNAIENWSVFPGGDPTSDVNAWDPLLTYGNQFATGDCSTLNPLTTLWNDRVLNYQIVDGTMRTMQEMAAYLARCGSNFYGTPSTSCFEFGGTVAGVYDIDVLNTEWNNLKAFYRSAKQEAKADLADCIALEDCQTYGGCIGNENDNPWVSGMLSLVPGPFWASQFYNALQPCSVYKRHLYKNKDRRFGRVDVLVPIQNPNEAAYEMYLQTGQCPVPFNVQSLLTSLAQDQALDEQNLILNNYGALTGLFLAANDYAMPGTIPVLTQNVLSSSTTLTVEWLDLGAQYALLNLTLPLGSTVVWDDLTSFINLTSTGVSSFTVEGVYDLGGLQIVTIDGTLTSFDLSSCSFGNECDLSDLGYDLEYLLGSLALTGNFEEADVDIDPMPVSGGPALLDVQTGLILSAANTGSDLHWQKITQTQFRLIDNLVDPLHGLYVNFNASIPVSFLWNWSDVVFFDNLLSGGSHTFTVDAILTNGDVVSLTGDLLEMISVTEGIGVPIGDCGLPIPAECQTPEHETFNALYDILNEAFTSGDLNNIDFFSSIYTDNSLTEQLDASLTATTSNYNVASGVLTITALDCITTLTSDDPLLTLSDVTEFVSMSVSGTTDNAFNYHDFTIEVLFNGVPGTISGTTCMSIQECFGCLPEVIDLSEIDTTGGPEGILPSPLPRFASLEAAVADFNTLNGFTPTDPEFVTTIGYVEFAKEGLDQPTPSYVRFIEHCIPGLDDPSYLSDPAKFAVDYGYGTNVCFEYERYLTGVNRYNNRAATAGAPTFAASSRPDFINSRVARRNGEYLTYLESMPAGVTLGQNIMSYFGATPTATSSEELLYKEYTDAYQTFEANQLAGVANCIKYAKQSPMFAIEDVEENNLFCSAEGLLLFDDYAASFAIGNCPIRFPHLKDCSPIAVKEDKKASQKAYMVYRDAIDEFNTSLWATVNAYVLEDEFKSAARFRLLAVEDPCLVAYLEYLETYISSPIGGVPSVPPLTMSQFGPCIDATKPVDPCLDAYIQYLGCINEYNEWATVTGSEFIYAPTLHYETFKKLDFCNCVDEFCARLEEVRDGLITFSDTVIIIRDRPRTITALQQFLHYLDFRNICDTPCDPGEPDGSPVVSIQITPVDDCVEMLLNQAYFEAQVLYEDYVNNLTGDLINEYNEHCMGVRESLTYTYFDKLYHFTLYYYDQAGNLIKTIPPEGVQFLNITASSDPLSLQIEGDRVNETKTVFTTHRLPTHYEYNSLNQLVSQASPDTDPMKVFELTLPSGLHAKLTTQKIQLINENTGYLAGSVGTRGYLYRTDDAGITWNRINGLVGADLKKSVMVDVFTGFAIGSNGTILKTLDGGATWDMIDFWGMTGATANLNDILLHDNGGSDEIIVVGDGGLVARSTDLVTFTIFNIGIDPQYDISSITESGSEYFITANGNQTATAYKRGFSVVSWIPAEDFTAGILYDADITSNNRAIAAGLDGRVYIYDDITIDADRWQMIETDVTGLINGIQFFDDQQGMAIMDDQLYRSPDGGHSWLEISTENYAHLAESKNSALVLATGDLGKMEIYVPSNDPTVPAIEVTNNFSPSPNVNIAAGWIDHTIVGPSSEYMMVVAREDGSFAVTGNGQDAYPAWLVFDESSTIGTNKVVDMKLRREGAGTDFVGGVLLDNGRLYYIKKETDVFGTVTFDFNTIPGLGQVIKAITYVPDADNVYAIHNSGIKRLKLNSGTQGNVGGVSTNAQAAVISDGFIAILGTKQTNIELNNPGTGINQITDQTKKTNPVKLLDAEYHPSISRVILTGSDGTMYTNSSDWALTQTTTNKDLYASTDESTGMYVVGESGYFSFGQIFGTTFSSTPVTHSSGSAIEALVSDDLYDMDMNGVRVYAVGQNGRVIYTSNYGTMPFESIVQGTEDLYGVTPRIGNLKMLAVGDRMQMNDVAASSFIQITELFTPPLIDVHFSSITQGTFLSDNFTVRKTASSGLDWRIVVPDVVPAIPYTSVWTFDPSRSVVMGAGDPMDINGLSATSITSTLSDVRSIDHLGNEFYVIDGTNLKTINDATFAQTDIVGSIGTANDLEVLADGSVGITGENGLFTYYDENLTQIFQSTPGDGLPASVDLNALTFVDNTYIVLVGDDGRYYKTDAQSIGIDGYLDGTFWIDVPLVGDLEPIIVAPGDADLYTIQFSSPNNAVFGGKYDPSFSGGASAGTPYVRNVYDPNSRYSSRFYYDRLGRLVVSQNSRQYNNPLARKYSYSLYDALGRVVEVGEKTENTGNLIKFKSVFGTSVSSYYNPSVIDDVQLLAWVEETSGERREVTRSYYDRTIITGLPATFVPDVLTQRKRITHVTYEEIRDNNDQTYDHATHYDYDIHGNVKTLLQDNREMAETFPTIASQRYKRMDYTYDLVSGNVHRMSVQSDEVDQWHHAYTYDSDNRITSAYTTNETPFLANTALPQTMENELINNDAWEEEARYFYYDHGPLARTEIGEDALQGCDYVYNIQGWLKGVNATSLDGQFDPGKDGVDGATNDPFGNDLMAFSLHYFDGDYQAINGTGQNHAASIDPTSHLASNNNDLFNGNIKIMQTTISNLNTHEPMPMANAYQYDQLNRLREARSYENGYNANAWNPTSYSNEYYNAFTYDAMGNILTQDRHLRDGTTKIEEMTYQYHETVGGDLVRNRLYHINDAIGATIDATDIDDMGTFDDGANINGANNYVYDEEGRLIKDVQEEIEEIIWRVDGKVSEINRISTSTKQNVSFDYDAMGNRIAKHVYSNSSGILEKSTYYILDAQGNTLNTYEHVVNPGGGAVAYNLKERQIYGSSRVGLLDDEVSMLAVLGPVAENVKWEYGKKYYELSNHLGNVLTVFNDIKTPLDETLDLVVDAYTVGIISSTDYSPFGVQLDGRSESNGSYRYGYQGSELDDEVKGDGNSYTTHFRQLDPRVGRWLSIDPKAGQLPWQSPYISMDNGPISLNDQLGDKVKIGKKKKNKDENALSTRQGKEVTGGTHDENTGEVFETKNVTHYYNDGKEISESAHKRLSKQNTRIAKTNSKIDAHNDLIDAKMAWFTDQGLDAKYNEDSGVLSMEGGVGKPTDGDVPHILTQLLQAKSTYKFKTNTKIESQGRNIHTNKLAKGPDALRLLGSKSIAISEHALRNPKPALAKVIAADAKVFLGLEKNSVNSVFKTVQNIDPSQFHRTEIIINQIGIQLRGYKTYSKKIGEKMLHDKITLVADEK